LNLGVKEISAGVLFLSQGKIAPHNFRTGFSSSIKDDHGNDDREQLFWLPATLIEALIGTGQSVRAASEKDRAIAEAPESWMAGSLEEQLGNLAEATHPCTG
jgi:hypothetical protein